MYFFFSWFIVLPSILSYKDCFGNDCYPQNTVLPKVMTSCLK